MRNLEGSHVVVIGLSATGRAAAMFLHRRGARVTVIDGQDTPRVRAVAEGLKAAGVEVYVGVQEPPAGEAALAVVTPGVELQGPLVRPLRERGVRVIGELELGYEYARCLSIAVCGTNGKTTTTELVERLLTQAGRRTVVAGDYGKPVCDVVEDSRELDFLTLEVSSFQLEAIEYFRPAVAVLLNITPDHLDWYANMADYIRANAQLFRNQQPFDWAIVQSEAYAQLRSLNLPVPSKVITFSANNRRADLYLDRSILISRVPEWTGPLLDMDTCALRGPHNAENLMAALAIGRVLRIPLEQMVSALRTYEAPRNRCEVYAEIDGVRFVNDSKATNLDAVHKALLAMPVGRSGEPNVLLIAGGKDKGFEFHDIGPVLSQRVKRAFLLGESREKMRAAWSLFTPCALCDSLLEAVFEAANAATSGDIVLLSPACSSFDMFQNYYHRGEVFRDAVRQWAQSTGRALPAETPSGGGGTAILQKAPPEAE